MTKRTLKIFKLTPIALSECESCGEQFQSRQAVEDDAEAEMRTAFDTHKCSELRKTQ
jgi:predicted nucleic acid-binding Zn ribbon protein